jgi:DNA excision repair protein ERCC-4
VELSQPADPGAALVYEALSELMDACVRDLRKNERLDTSDLTASRGLLASFDEAVRRQLAPVWHTVAPRTRQLVADLRTLRALASYLLRFDAVTFLTYLDTLRATEGVRCVWLFHSAAHTVFEAAKARVYRLGRAPAPKRRRQAEGAKDAAVGAAAAATVPVVEPVLQELRKWHALREVLEEVGREREALLEAAAADEAAGDGAAAGVRREAAAAPALVFCQDAFTCGQLQEVLGPEGPAGHMQRLYREYLQYKLDTGAAKGRSAGGGNDAPAGPPQPGGGGGGGAPASRMMGGYKPGEESALAKEARAVTVDPDAEAGAAPAGGGGRGRGGGRGGRGGRGRGRKGGSVAMEAAAAAAAAVSSAAVAPPAARESPAAAAAAAAPAPNPPHLDAPGGVKVRLVALDAHNCLALWDALPSFVVVYDPDVALTRSLELYKAQRRGRPLRVYLLRYDDSPEMDRYQAAVVRERSAFEALIKAKEIMALPVAAAPPPPPPPLLGAPDPAAAAALGGGGGNALTRRAGGRASSRPTPRRLVVDVREFMSPLPAVLHAQGLELVPLTLEVGDYVLSPEICVERKSLPDLRGSLASGRLYQQADAMCRHYKTPVLLIEFEGDRAFALQAAADLGDDVQVNALTSRLTLLCLHFPRLRLIWSRSLHATAQIFRELKANQEEPDPAGAAAVGVPQDADGGGGGGGGGGGVESVVNQAAIDLLRRLPGVTDGNWRAVMREAGSLAGLAGVPEGRLAAAMGGEAAARKLRDFLDQECRALFRAL